jgi:TonB family protein
VAVLRVARLPAASFPREAADWERTKQRAGEPARETTQPTVRLKVIVDSDGVPETTLVVRSSGDAQRDEEAKRAAAKMRFPARRGVRVTYANVVVPDGGAPRLRESLLGQP